MLSQLAVLSPSTVLPLLASRFRAALATATATHTLAAAVTAMALAVRPLLAAGQAVRAAEGEEAEEAPQVGVWEVVGGLGLGR